MSLLSLSRFVTVATLFGIAAVSGKERPNILFIAVDDLRPELGCYGSAEAKSPHIDRFAKTALRFDRAYCQVPVCGASRASLMTSVLPTASRFTVAQTRVDEDAPNTPTLPETLKMAGYVTLSNGKIFHFPDDTAASSWNEEPWMPDTNNGTHLDPETVRIMNAEGRGRIYEAPDVPDNAYSDGKVADRTIQDLRRLKVGKEPFFLACGFIRPHMPFYAPKKYWDMYDRNKIPIASNRERPIGAPAILRGSSEYKRYHFGEYRDGTEDFHRMMRHGYLASMSYTDQMVGNVLAELDRLELAQDTIVVIWGDHGWNLGEHDFWGKHNTTHLAMRVPLLIRVPRFPAGAATSALVETLDIFPTLCQLAGVTPPATVQGKSFASLLQHPEQKGFREFIYSRFRPADAVVTERFTYTSYGASGEMMYDLEKDPGEDRNIVAAEEYRADRERMKALLARSMNEAAAAKVRDPIPLSERKPASPLGDN